MKLPKIVPPGWLEGVIGTGIEASKFQCPWSISDDGHVVQEGLHFSVFQIKGGADEQLGQLMVDLASNGEDFRLFGLTRPIHFYEYQEQLWGREGGDTEFIEEHLKLLSPQAIGRRDPRWRLPLAREIYLVIRSQKDLEETLISRSGFGFTVRRLDVYQLVSMLNSVLNHLALDPDSYSKEVIDATKDLRKLVAVDEWLELQPGTIGVKSRGHEVWWGFGQLVHCPSSLSVGDLAQFIGNSGYDVVIDVKPLDRISEANQLLQTNKITEEARRLASKYRRGADAPLEVQMMLVFRANNAAFLDKCYEGLAKTLRSRFGVTIRRQAGADAMRAYETFSPTLIDKVPANPMKVAARDAAGMAKSLGQMKVPVAKEVCLHLGQDLQDQMPIFCPLGNMGGPINAGIFGQTGKGKTVLARYLFWQLLALGYRDLVVADFKGQGDWGEFVSSVVKGAPLIRLSPDKDPDAAGRIAGLSQRPTVIVLESSTGSEGTTAMAKSIAEVWQRLRTLGRRSFVFFDESWVAFEHEGNPAGEMMKHFAKQGRGAGISSIFITQDPLDVTSAQSGAGRVGEQVIAQCPVQILGGLSAVGLDLLNRWGVDSRLTEMVPHLEVGQFVINGLSGGKEVQLWLTKPLLDRICPPARQ